MKNIFLDINIDGERSNLIEICGPAGAGKTTLLKSLKQSHEIISEGVRLKRIMYFPFFASNMFSMLPIYLLYFKQSRWFTWREIRSMVYLNAWYYRFKHQVSNNDEVTVLDHGPIYRLAHLREFGPEFVKSRFYERWWVKRIEQWAMFKFMIVWLDAPNDELMKRINCRNRWHVIKGKSGRDAYEFLTRYRRSYEEIIRRLLKCGGLKLICFDTQRESVENIVDRVLATLRCRPNET